MNDDGGRGEQFAKSQEIYFRDHREHRPEYPDVYPNIRAGLLRFIMRNPPTLGILAIRHAALPSRLDARMLPEKARADTAEAGALRIGEGLLASAGPGTRGTNVRNYMCRLHTKFHKASLDFPAITDTSGLGSERNDFVG